MKKEWFEPGPDGKSPFSIAYLQTPSGMSIDKSISAAFRALLAGEGVMSKESSDMAIEQANRLRDALNRLAKWEGYEGDREWWECSQCGLRFHGTSGDAPYHTRDTYADPVCGDCGEGS